jgi:hypothetical protein
LREIDDMVKLYFSELFEIEDKALEVDEEERREGFKLVILLDGFYFPVAVIARVVGYYLMLDVFVETLLQSLEVFYF